MIRHLPTIAFAAALLGLSSCAGYKLGGIKPASLAGVKTIAVPMLSNATQHPRANALATSAVTNAIVQEGTYRIGTSANADAVLVGEITEIKYRAIRGTRFDSLYPEELSNRVTLKWTLMDARDPSRVLATSISRGESQLFVSTNLQTARNNALPEALERAGEALVSTLANGY